MEVVFSINTATEDMLLSHLIHCDMQFLPSLSKKVILKDYAAKITQNAIVFEAWLDNILIGMVAMYLNDNNCAYITNVSVYSEFGGKGIAKQLFVNLISFANKKKIKNIKLEVNPTNVPAINLYLQFGFQKVEESSNQLIMLKKIIYS